MRIRPAQPDDVPAVLPMVARTCAFHERADPAKYPFRPGVVQGYDGWLRQRAVDERSVFLVADAGEGALAGFLVGTVEREIPIYRIADYGFVHDLWVDEEHRHRGVGRQLVEAALRRFAGMGLRQVRLDVACANEAARRLFAECGLRPSVVEMLIELPAGDGSPTGRMEGKGA